MTSKDRAVEEAFGQVATAIDQRIKPIFKAGVVVTVIVRTPGHDDRDMIVTDDKLSEAIRALERSAIRSLLRWMKSSWALAQRRIKP
jgi:hypothetical protein